MLPTPYPLNSQPKWHHVTSCHDSGLRAISYLGLVGGNELRVDERAAVRHNVRRQRTVEREVECAAHRVTVLNRKRDTLRTCASRQQHTVS